MALCGICEREVVSHRYLRAEPMRVENGRVTTPYQLKETAFYCLRHDFAEIEQLISEIYPPTSSVPLRLLWAPAPGVRLPHAFEPPKQKESMSHEDFMRAIGNCGRCGELWSAGIHDPQKLPVGVRERNSKDGNHQVRTIVVQDKAALHMAFPNLLPPGTRWLVAHTGVPTAEQAVDVLIDTLGLDHPASEAMEALREQVIRLGDKQ